MVARYFYWAYGLRIRSALRLPLLLPCSEGDGCDAVVRLGKGSGPPRFSWKGVGSLWIRKEGQIIVQPAEGAGPEQLQPFIIGPALTTLLHQRGKLLLHASSVVIRDQAVAFLGGNGFGKSTLAAAFHRRGYGVVTDDVVVVEVNGRGPTVYPAFPRLKLLADSLRGLRIPQAGLIPYAPWLNKKVLPVPERFPSSPLPLSRIYVIARGTTEKASPLSPQKALAELIRHSYSNRLLKEEEAPGHFLQCVQLVREVPVRLLRRSKAFSSLPRMIQIVERDYPDGC